MAQLSAAITAYHQLFDQDGYRDLSWAEDLQERMRHHRLLESGRLIAPILRPQFISRSQLDNLVRAAEHLMSIVGRVQRLVLQSPVLLNRLGLLPAEKTLIAVPSRFLPASVTSSLDAYVQNGSVCLRGLETCKPKAFAFSEPLCTLFLDLPIVKAFKRNGYRLSKIGNANGLLTALRQTWTEFGGANQPNIAILDLARNSGSSAANPQSDESHLIGESHLILDLCTRSGVPARHVSPSQLEYSNGKLRAGDFRIDIVLRRFLAREFLAQFDLSHPLFAAYRDSAVCVVNDFRSEITHSRTFFELLTDESVTAQLDLADRKLIQNFVPWTRFVSLRKTIYKGAPVDLPDFIRLHRAKLVLRPNHDGDEAEVFVGAKMPQSAWDNAVRTALRSPYVVQERLCCVPELVPVFQYGELRMKEAQASLHPHLFGGKLHAATAALESSTFGRTTPLAVAPVLLIEKRSA